jgi:ligand-binding sensor domain-containing protein
MCKESSHGSGIFRQSARLMIFEFRIGRDRTPHMLNDLPTFYVSSLNPWLRPLLMAVLTFGCASSGLALDPTRSITQYSITSWEIEEGLPQNTVRDIVQTPDGYLWFGTQAGLVRFDGVQFQIFDRRSHEIFRNHHVYALAVDADGVLWVGTNGGGILQFEHGEFRYFGEEHGLPTGRITCLERGIDGEMWAGTYGGGLVRFVGDEVEVFGTAAGLSHGVVFDLAVGVAGEVWVATYGGGINRFRDGAFESWGTEQGLPSNGAWAVEYAADGAVWVGTNGGLSRFENGAFQTTTRSEGLSHDRVISLHEDRDGNLWVGTYGGGLSRFRDGRWSSLDHRTGLSGDIVWSLFEDDKGSLWVGTLGYGLNQIQDGPFTTFGVAEGLSSAITSGLFEDRKGTLWVGTRGAGLNSLDGSAFNILTTRDGLSTDGVWSVLEDTQRTLWVGTNGGGLNFRDEEGWHHIRARDGLAGDNVIAITEDRNGAIWAGTNRGLSRCRGSVCSTYTIADGLASDQVRSFAEDREGRLWVGTTGGLSRFDGERFTSFTTADGLSSNNVFDIYLDDAGILWLGTYGGGLSRFDGKIFTNFTSRDGLYDDDIATVLEDDFGYFWLGSSRGVFRVLRTDLENYGGNPSRPISYVAYGRRDGLGNSAGHPQGLKTRDGRIWFSHLGGVSVVDPSSLEIEPAPAIILEEFTVGGESIPPAAVLPSSSRNFEFHFAAPTLRVPEKVKLRYQLRGFDLDWTVSKGRVASYSLLSPGTYTFVVMASDEYNAWTGLPKEFTFTVAPAFYQTWPFFLLSTLGIIGIVAGFHHLRVRSLHQREAELTVRIEESLDRIKVLRGLLPICAACTKVKEDDGSWRELQSYVDAHSEASFTHGMCPDCAQEFYSQYIRPGKDQDAGSAC